MLRLNLPGRALAPDCSSMLEGLMRDREFPSVQPEASSNARGFYLRRGYRATGPQTSKGAWPMLKEHLA